MYINDLFLCIGIFSHTYYFFQKGRFLVIMIFLLALSPIIWLIISLGFLKMQSFKACPIALLISFAVALLQYNMPGTDAITAAVEGAALACWPILLVIIAAIFTYNLTVYTKSMDIIKHMLTTVSKDRRVLALLIGWGFGAFMEGMAGFGTAIAIPASMLVALGFDPIKSILLCLIANSVPTTYGSIGIPASTLANLTGLDPVTLSTYISLQLLPLNIISPFLMVIVVGGSIKALKGVFLLTLLCGLGLAIPELLISMVAGPELAVMISSIVILAIIVAYAKLRPTNDPTYFMDINPGHVPLHGGVLACLPFILIFVFLLLTSKFVPAINVPLSSIKTSVLIYTGANATPYTFVWLATPGVLIFLAAFISGRCQSASFKEIFTVLGQTIKGLRNTIITIIAVIATAKVMGYSGMTSDIAATAVAATGTMYPIIAPLIGSVGTFITGSGTSSNVLFGNLQTDAAGAINANKAWLAAANSTGTCAGKMISPQSIAIAVGAISLVGKDSEILKSIIIVYVPYIIALGCIVYFGQFLVG